jgi:hypothetical protein
LFSGSKALKPNKISMTTGIDEKIPLLAAKNSQTGLGRTYRRLMHPLFFFLF